MRRGLLIVPALYLAACFLPALEFQDRQHEQDIMLGLRALAIGWSGIFAGVVAWYANPLWLIGLILAFLRQRIAAAVLGAAAIPIALTTFSVVGQELPADEGNVTKMVVVAILPGCYVWLASLAALPVAALFQEKKTPTPPPLPRVPGTVEN